MTTKIGKTEPPVVDPGHAPVVVATEVVAVDRGQDYVQITFGFDQMFGKKHIQETDVCGRLVLTMHAFAALKAALIADAEIAAQVVALIH